MQSEFRDLLHGLEVFYDHIRDHLHVSSGQSRADIHAHQRIHNDAVSVSGSLSGHIQDRIHVHQSSRVDLLLHSDVLLHVREVLQHTYDRGDAYTHAHLCGRMDHLRIQYHDHDDYVNSLRQFNDP